MCAAVHTQAGSTGMTLGGFHCWLFTFTSFRMVSSTKSSQSPPAVGTPANRVRKQHVNGLLLLLLLFLFRLVRDSKCLLYTCPTALAMTPDCCIVAAITTVLIMPILVSLTCSAPKATSACSSKGLDVPTLCQQAHTYLGIWQYTSAIAC